MFKTNIYCLNLLSYFGMLLLVLSTTTALAQETEEGEAQKVINPLSLTSDFEYQGYVYQMMVSPKPDHQNKGSLVIRKREIIEDDAATYREVYSSFIEIEQGAVAKVRVFHAAKENYRWRPSTTNLLLGEFDRKRGKGRFTAEGEKMQNRKIQGKVDFERVMKEFEPADFQLGHAVIATIEFFIMGYPGLLGR
ncbi:MAG: hypothetical protein JJT94_16155 [Bernardetiaceae bacterium]|nr:hypothetical protein [Bernardetiaceae bacterium]